MEEGRREGRSEKDLVCPQCQMPPWPGEAGAMVMAAELTERGEYKEDMERGLDTPGVETPCHVVLTEEESSEEMTAVRRGP